MNSTTELSATLSRISQKAGVRATVVIERSSGTILETTGSFSSSHAQTAMKIPPFSSTAPAADPPTATRAPTGVEEMATMVWNFVNTAGGLVQELDSEDDVKLLRLRTKKHELVIVPDAKYLLIVVHDTPAA